MKKLVIDRSKWANAVGKNGPSNLYNRYDCQCCVGIYLSSCGVEADQLKGRAVAESPDILPDEAKWLVIGSDRFPFVKRSGLAQQLYSANDDFYRSEEQREKDIALLFAQAGVEVEFTGEYPAVPRTLADKA